MSKAFARLVLVLLGVLSFNSVFAASAGWSRSRGFHQWYLRGGYSGGYGWGGYRSSTAAEGYLRGMGAYFDGLGNLRVSNAIAQTYLQQAYTQYLENDLLRLKVRYEKREIHDAYMAKKHPRQTREDRERVAKVWAPNRLVADDRDAATGALKWPTALTDAAYEEDRATIESLFTERAEKPDQSGAGSAVFQDIEGALDALSDKLRAHIRQMSSVDYVAASRFLRTLSYEARFKP